MVRYISKRIAQSILVLFLVSIVIYGLMYMMPGDPVYAVYGTNLKPGQYEEKYIEMGLDKPVYERYAKWLGGVFQGNLGSSTKYHMPVATLIKARLPVTLYIGGWSILLGTIIGVVLGIVCAMHARKMTDNILTVLANIGCAVPDFWIAVILVAVFSTTLGLLPSFGFSFPWENGFADSFKQLVMPVIAMTVGTASITTRQTRASIVEVQEMEFVRATRAKGCKESKVMFRHIFRNALIPIVTHIGLMFPVIIAGAVTIERIFAIPGMGDLMVTGVLNQDTAVVQACILILAASICLANLIVDIVYCIVDPRIKLQ